MAVFNPPATGRICPPADSIANVTANTERIYRDWLHERENNRDDMIRQHGQGDKYAALYQGNIDGAQNAGKKFGLSP